MRYFHFTENKHKRLGVAKDVNDTVDLLVSIDGEQWFTNDEQYLDSFSHDPVIAAALQTMRHELNVPEPMSGMKMEGM